MHTNDPKKITVRALHPDKYLDELPLDYYRHMVDGERHDHMTEKFAKVNRRWYCLERFVEI